MTMLPFSNDAACLGSDTNQFFISTGESSKPAKAICKDCKVRKECLDWAIKYKITFGVWGGKTVRERRKITKELVATGVKSVGEVAPVVTDKKVDEAAYALGRRLEAMLELVSR